MNGSVAGWDEVDENKGDLDLPEGRKSVGWKWVYKIKYVTGINHQVRYKARLVAKEYALKYGKHFEEVFTPVVQQTTLRTLLTVTVKREEGPSLKCQDSLREGVLEEDLYMDQSLGLKPYVGWWFD